MRTELLYIFMNGFDTYQFHNVFPRNLEDNHIHICVYSGGASGQHYRQHKLLRYCTDLDYKRLMEIKHI